MHLHNFHSNRHKKRPHLRQLSWQSTSASVSLQSGRNLQQKLWRLNWTSLCDRSRNQPHLPRCVYCFVIPLDCWQSVFLSIIRGGFLAGSSSSPLGHTTLFRKRHLRSQWLNPRPSDPWRKTGCQQTIIPLTTGFLLWSPDHVTFLARLHSISTREF